MKLFTLILGAAGVLCAADFQTGQAARLVIGQSTFTTETPGASEVVLGAASGLAYSNNTLFVVDSARVPANPQNHRVLIYNDLAGQLPGPYAKPDEREIRCGACVGRASVVVGQTDFSKTDLGLSQSTMRNPTSIATDGRRLVIADTDNNRVLIWNSIPQSNGTPADVVIGQPDFKTASLNFGGAGNTPSAKGLRGPQGVWIQNGRLFVADSQNHRVLIWNQIPTANGAEANVVLGQTNFTSFVEPDLTKLASEARGTNMLNPVSVTSDGTRLFVTDLGFNRVLVWNSMPTQNAQTADFALGQPEVASTTTLNASAANNSTLLCEATGEKTDDGKDIYPEMCAATLNFPRFALSDGTRLFVADGGNDRVLVWNTMPVRSGQPADAVLGQLNDKVSQSGSALKRSAADTVRTPMSLAWDGTNLYVSDPFNRRVMVFTPGDRPLIYNAVRNAASQEIFAVATIRFSADPKENDEVTVKIADKEYKYKAVKDDLIEDVIAALVAQINGGAGDAKVFATPNNAFFELILTARVGGPTGSEITVSVTTSAGAQLVASASGATLRGGQDAAVIAPGSLITLIGQNLAPSAAAADLNRVDLPIELAGTRVYIDGVPAPLTYVSPTQINAQMPWEVNDAYSVSAYVRTTDASGSPKITSAIAVPVAPQNPGLFADPGIDPRPAIALHGSSYATALVSVDGAAKENDVATVTIEDREYKYTVKKDDTLTIIRNALVAEINNDEKVEAVASTIYTRILLRARVPGKEGEGITFSAKVNDGASVILTALAESLCCSNTEGARVTEANPARPGEQIIIYGTGLGLVGPDEAKFSVLTGWTYNGPDANQPNSPIDAIAGGKTANVVFAGLKRGTVGIYELRLQLNTDVPTNPQTQLTIAQENFVSNIVTFPVLDPADEIE